MLHLLCSLRGKQRGKTSYVLRGVLCQHRRPISANPLQDYERPQTTCHARLVGSTRFAALRLKPTRTYKESLSKGYGLKEVDRRTRDGTGEGLQQILTV